MKEKYKIFDEKLLKLLKAEVIKEFNSDLKTNSQSNLLVNNIVESTGRSIGNSTVRRFFGLDRSHSKPSQYTLDTFSIYAGYESFEAFSSKNKTNKKTKKKEETQKTFRWEDFKKIAFNYSNLNFKIFKNRLKLPFEIVIERQKTSEFISSFLKSDKIISAVVAPPDCGKSTAIAKFIEKEWFGDSESENILIYISPCAFTQLLNKNFDLNEWFASVSKGFDLASCINHFNQNEAERKGQLLFIVDTIELITKSSKNFDLFVNSFIKYVSTYENIKWAKVLLLSRTSTWNSFISFISKYQALEKFLFKLPFKQTNESLINFELLSKDEIEKIIKLALKKVSIENYQLIRPIFTTNIQQLLKYPFFLEIYIKNFLIDAETSLSEAAVISRFIDDKITNSEHSEENRALIEMFLKETNFGLASNQVSKSKLLANFKHKNTLIAFRELLDKGFFKERLVYNKRGVLSNYLEMRNQQIFLYFIARQIAMQFKTISIRTFLYVLNMYGNYEELKYDILCWLIKICFFEKNYELILKLKDIILKIKTIEIGNQFIENSGLEAILLTIKNELSIDLKAQKFLLPKMAKYAEWQEYFFEYNDDLDYINLFYGDSILSYLLYNSTDKGMLFAHSILLTKNVFCLNQKKAKFHFDILDKIKIDLNFVQPKLLGRVLSAKTYYLLVFKRKVPLYFWEECLAFERKFIYSNTYKNYYPQFYIELIPATSLAQRYDLVMYFWERIFPHYEKLLEQVWGGDYERTKLFVANALLERGQYEDARIIFNSFRKEKINNSRAASHTIFHIVLSKLLFHENKADEARASLEQAIFISRSINSIFFEKFAESIAEKNKKEQ